MQGPSGEQRIYERNKNLYELKKYKLIGKYYPNSEPYQFSIYHCVYTISNPESKIQYVYEDLEESKRILERIRNS